MQYCNILTLTVLDKTFSYQIPKLMAELQVGQLVTVPLRNRLVLGVVNSLVDPLANSPINSFGTQPTFGGEVKFIKQKFDFVLPPISLQFAAWVANYTLIPLGQVLKMVVGLPIIEINKVFKQKTSLSPINYNISQPISLSLQQKEAVGHIIQALQSFKTFVLDGVTGSGKTEVYLSVIEEVIKNQAQVLVLLPEISLTHQFLERFSQRFGCKPLVWHSNVKQREKRQILQRLLTGQAAIVVGARSALFLPFHNLQLIIVDEEHDDSYKQQEQNHYHARDMAVVRAKFSGIPIILASATPSLETINNINQGRYYPLELTNRFAGAKLPQISLVDMRKEQPGQWISAPLQQAINKNLAAAEQTILFLNRRGYAPLTLCRTCGYRFMCAICDVWLVQHKVNNNPNNHLNNYLRLECHHCGFTKPLPKNCPECQCQQNLVACGPGVEMVEEEVAQLFPKARVLVVTSDRLANYKSTEIVIESIKNHQVDIIIGTQILAKGHHFPLLTLVGVIDADLGLSGSDLRASERTYQLLHQVSGRAGREQRQGYVLLQTYYPDHPLFQAVQQQQRNQFYNYELNDRQQHDFPPFGFLASIIVSGLDSVILEKYVRLMAQNAPQDDNITLLGPVMAPISRLRGRCRWRFLLKSIRPMLLQKFIKYWLNQPQLRRIPGNTRITIDIDPHSFF